MTKFKCACGAVSSSVDGAERHEFDNAGHEMFEQEPSDGEAHD